MSSSTLRNSVEIVEKFFLRRDYMFSNVDPRVTKDFWRGAIPAVQGRPDWFAAVEIDTRRSSSVRRRHRGSKTVAWA